MTTSFRCRAVGVAFLVIGALLVAVAARSQSAKTDALTGHESAPYWAFAVDPPAAASGANAEPVDDSPRHVPGSVAAFTLAQLRDMFNAPDWHPDNHPAMPDVVAHGSKPGVFACGYCHLPNGQGRPENSSLAGLPESYIVQQIADF